MQSRTTAKLVLLVDDSEDDILLTKLTLQKVVGNPIKAVKDGCEAIAYLGGTGAYSDREQYPMPAILFVDLKMPKVDGFGVLEWMLKHANSKFLTIVLSHSGQVEDIERAHELGANAYLTKPLKRDNMVHLVAQFRDYWELQPVSVRL